MTGEAAFSRLLAELYAGVSDPERMRRFIARASLESNSHIAGLTRRNYSARTGDLPHYVGEGASEEMRARYEAQFVTSRENLWYERSMPTLRTGSIVNGDMFATKREIKSSRYHADFLRSIDTVHSIALCGLLKGTHAAILTFGRSERAGEYDSTQQQFFQALSPHFVNAYSLMTQFEGLQQQPPGGSVAMFSMDEQWRWIGASPGAERMVALGWWNGRPGGRVEPAAHASKIAWVAAQRQATHGRPHQAPLPMPIFDAQGQLVAFASLRPYGRHAVGEGLPHFVATVRPLRAIYHCDLEAALISLFSMTASEAKFASILAEVESLAIAAQSLGIGENSARTRLQAVFTKTGMHRQSDLLRMLEALGQSV